MSPLLGNTLFPVGDSVWVNLGDVAFLEKLCYWWWALRCQKSCAISSVLSLLPICGFRCERSDARQHGCYLLPCFPPLINSYFSGTVSQVNPSFYKLLWLECFSTAKEEQSIHTHKQNWSIICLNQYVHKVHILSNSILMLNFKMYYIICLSLYDICEGWMCQDISVQVRYNFVESDLSYLCMGSRTVLKFWGLCGRHLYPLSHLDSPKLTQFLS